MISKEQKIKVKSSWSCLSNPSAYIILTVTIKNTIKMKIKNFKNLPNGFIQTLDCTDSRLKSLTVLRTYLIFKMPQIKTQRICKILAFTFTDLFGCSTKCLSNLKEF